MNRRKLLFAGLCAAGVICLGSARANAAGNEIAPKTLEFLEATTISGYVQASYVYNIKSGTTGVSDQNQANNSANAGGANQLRAFDNNVGFTLNAVKLVLEKPLGEGDWAAGYRVDLIFGQDAQRLNVAEGSSALFFDADDDSPEEQGDGLYLEQGYVAFRVPVGNGIDFKFGRFVALSGYEVIEGPANLNFSRGLLFTWASPLAHTGILGSYRLNDSVDVQLGLVNGWNSWVDENTEPALIGRVGFRNSSGNFATGVSGFYGRARTQDGAFAGAGIDASERWHIDIVSNFKPTEQMLVGLNFLVGDQDESFGESDTAHDMYWGIAGYLRFQLNEKVSLAGRAEYLNDRNGFLFDDNHASFDPNHDTDRAGGKGSRIEVWSLTTTVTFDVWKNMLLRVEGRYDQASETGNGKYNAPFSPKNDQLTFSVDAVYSF